MNPIEQFLSDSEKRLSGRLTADKVAALLAETRRHMTLRAEELQAAGLAPNVAVATAASAFGTPRQWTYDILTAEGYRPYVRPGNLVSIVGFAFCLLATPFAALAVKNVATGQMSLEQSIPIFVTGFVVTILAWVAAPLGALLAGRCDIKALVAIAAAVTVFTGIAVGTTAPALKNVFREANSVSDLQRNQQERDLLQLGIQTYNNAAAPAVLPADLKTPGGYLAPKENSEAHAAHETETVATKEIAAQKWRDFGAQRLADCERERLDMQRKLIHGASDKPASFDFHYAWSFAFNMLFQGGWFLGCCLVAAHIGRSIQQSRTAQRLRTQTD